MIQVKVANLSISNVGFVLLLKGVTDERTLPIFIGVPEAQAIAIQLNKTALPRPLTHDLMKNLLDVLEGRLEAVEICDIKDGTFYGRLVIAFEGQVIHLDARPSDAVALALRYHAPIFVAAAVMKEAAMVIEPEEAAGAEKAVNKKAGAAARPAEDAGKPADPARELRAKLEQAVREERYEEAARLRDQIKQMASSN